MKHHRCERARSIVCALSCAVLTISMMLQAPLAASAQVVIADGTTVLDSEKYSETVQVPVTLYDYGCEDEDGNWVTKDPTILNEGLEYGFSDEDVTDIKSMFFWDSKYLTWDDGDYSSFVKDGKLCVAGYYSWGMFEREFEDWSSIIAVPSRDLFGTSDESCSYDGTVFKQVYEDVLMEFSYDPDNNIYHYSSNESDATFYEDSGLIEKADLEDISDSKGFWPFGESEVHFGLAMDFDFYLPSQTYLDNNEYYFAFSGDDDLVVYIDDKLALDLGGAHVATAGYIDFANEIVVYGLCSSESQQANFEKSVAESGIEMITEGFDEAGIDWTEETYGYVTFESLGIDLDTSSEHNFKLAYLERGGAASNLTIEMNMQIQADVDYEIAGDVSPSDELTDPVPTEEGTFYLYDSYDALPGLTTEDEGYYFYGWYADEECTEPWADGTLLASASTTLYGKWVHAVATKTADPETGTTLNPGDTISYTVEYTNEDSVNQKVFISDYIPDYTTLVDDTVVCEGGTADLGLVEDGKGTICATWDAVEPGETVELVFSVTVDEDAAGQTISNTANVSIDDGTIVLTTNETTHEAEEPETVALETADDDSAEEEVEVVVVDGEKEETASTGSLPKTGDPMTIGVIVALLGGVGGGIGFLVRAMFRRHLG